MKKQNLFRKIPAAFGLCTVLALGGCNTMDMEGTGAAQAHDEAELAAARSGVALKLARAARDAGDMNSAINLYQSVVAATPSDSPILVELGDAQLDAGAIDDAVVTFQKIDPKSSSQLGAMLGLERAHLMLSEPVKALEFADKAVALAPKDKRAQIGRGVALDMLGRHEEAQSCYHVALDLAPNDVAARSDLALSLALTKQFDEAIKIMTPIARAPTATARLRQNLAVIYGLKGDDSAARALSRTDLTPHQIEANLHFFDLVRNEQK